jgi:uncharacterized protein (UPF0332 family)
MMSVALHAPSARSAYLAAFHAAQALIYERTSRVAKTHSGVQTEFAQLTKADATLPPELRAFLGRGYKFKTAADYAVGPAALISADEARMALDLARRFVGWVAAR